jgi:dTDP-glucose 4,6-dehydratase
MMKANILVTGGCGFIGSNFIHFIMNLEQSDVHVTNVDKLTYAGNPDNLRKYEDHPQYSFFKTDICDQPAIEKIMAEREITHVVHFAAESHVDRSIDNASPFIETNIFGTHCLLEAARKLKTLERFHHVSTDEVFGSLGAKGYFSETTSYDPSSPYSASKAASDHLVRAYHRTYNLPITISNCSNNYGPYQFPEKLIPFMLGQMLQEKPLPVYGDGKNVRDWLYVLDHCKGIYQILTDGLDGQTYVLGGNCEKTNLEIISELSKTLEHLGIRPKNHARFEDLISFVPDRAGHDFRYAIDAQKIKNELGWQPEASFQSGLQDTVGWYLENQKWVERILDGSYHKDVA